MVVGALGSGIGIRAFGSAQRVGTVAPAGRRSIQTMGGNYGKVATHAALPVAVARLAEPILSVHRRPRTSLDIGCFDGGNYGTFLRTLYPGIQLDAVTGIDIAEKRAVFESEMKPFCTNIRFIQKSYASIDDPGTHDLVSSTLVFHWPGHGDRGDYPQIAADPESESAVLDISRVTTLYERAISPGGWGIYCQLNDGPQNRLVYDSVQAAIKTMMPSITRYKGVVFLRSPEAVKKTFNDRNSLRVIHYRNFDFNCLTYRSGLRGIELCTQLATNVLEWTWNPLFVKNGIANTTDQKEEAKQLLIKSFSKAQETTLKQGLSYNLSYLLLTKAR
ncbi:class I SAM-dependent methyltransferase [bacterium]|nr:class I SAM-dependent methyltransferase [bacterium]